MKLKDRVAVITGGARGIGRAIAERYADEGARVVIADILEADAGSTAQAIGRGAFGLKLDVTDQASIDAMVRAVVGQAGRIDILVNNAAIFNMAPVLEVTRKDWDLNFDINTKGLFFTLQAVARRMLEQAAAEPAWRGKIINMSSQAGRRGESLVSAYCASKAAVISITQSTAKGLIPHRINVNGIAPGVVDTPMWDEVDRLFAKYENLPIGEKKRQVGEAVPFGRMGVPEDHVGAAVFLASADADYVLAQTLNVDGGNWMSWRAMPLTLGVNTNAFVNRIVEPEELVRTVVEEIGLRRIQLTPEILSPDWPAAVIAAQVRRWNAACAKHGARITTTFTGNYTRLNSLCHPDPDVRAHWRAWLERLIDITSDLGASATGSQIGILTYADDRDPARRAARFAVARDHWHALAGHAKGRGLACLMWEPMSISREFGQTIEACKREHAALNEGSPLPILINADIDHGDVTSPNPADTDPYAWAEALATLSPVVHIKQSSMDKGGHRPFTAAYNAKGRVVPERLIQALERGGGRNNELVFEFTFREREPTDSEVVAALRKSVDFWRGHVSLA